MVVRLPMPGPTPALPKLPPPPARRCGSSRWGTLCFWALLALFLLLLIYLGLLAFTGYNGTLQSSGLHQGPGFAGAVLGFCAAASVAACITATHPRH